LSSKFSNVLEVVKVQDHAKFSEAKSSSSWTIVFSTGHSFPWKILPNSVRQFAKFCGLPWQNHPNSAAFHF